MINTSANIVSCRFCGCAHDMIVTDVSHIQMLSRGRLVECHYCHAMSTIETVTHDVGPQGQATFHELSFGTDSQHFPDYIKDASLLRRVVSHDYPAYWGNKISELILEVGAGRGSLLKALLDEGYSAIGCEYSEKLVRAGQTAYQLPSDIFFQLNAWDLPKYLQDNSIRPSTVVFWHVIEHIENSLSLLDSLLSACTEQITFIFQTPLPVPEYIFPEHLFFPSTETYHFLADRLRLSINLLQIEPHTRFLTCVMSNKNIPHGNIYPMQSSECCFSVIGQLIFQLDSSLQSLDQITKQQYQEIMALKSQLIANSAVSDGELHSDQLLKNQPDISFSMSSISFNLESQIARLAADTDWLNDEYMRLKRELSFISNKLMHDV